MKSSIHSQLEVFVKEKYGADAPAILSYLPTTDFDFSAIRAVMINEVVADSPENDFYSEADHPYYMQTTLQLFHMAGVNATSIADILNMGIYITSAVKVPKQDTTIETDHIKSFVPLLEKELALFPSLQAIMLMGDVAKKAINMISKSKTGKNAVPSGSTYKLRHTEIVYDGIRLLPAYIMTGKNLAIEKSKSEMSAEELVKMLKIIGWQP